MPISAHALALKVQEYNPGPWIVVPKDNGQEKYGQVYDAGQHPDTDAPLATADLDTCRLIVTLVNRELGAT